MRFTPTSHADVKNDAVATRVFVERTDGESFASAIYVVTAPLAPRSWQGPRRRRWEEEVVVWETQQAPEELGRWGRWRQQLESVVAVAGRIVGR